MYVVGSFTYAGGRYIPNLAVWDGSQFHHMDVKLQTTAFSTDGAVLVHPLNGNIFIGGNMTAAGQALCSAINLITNPGTTEAKPVVYVVGPGYLRWIENQSTGKRIYFDMVVDANEEIVIDFGAGTVESAAKGSLLYTILPGSDFGAFSLIPGENRVAIFMTNDVGAQMSIQFQPAHWSADAVGKGETL